MEQRNSGHVRGNWRHKNSRRGNDRRKTGYGGEMSSREGERRNSGDPLDHVVGGDGDGGSKNKNLSFYGKSIVYHNSRPIDLEPGMKGILTLLVINQNSTKNEGIEEMCKVVDKYSTTGKETDNYFWIIDDTRSEQIYKALLEKHLGVGELKEKETIECLPWDPSTKKKDEIIVAHKEEGRDNEEQHPEKVIQDNPFALGSHEKPKTLEGLESNAKFQEEKPDEERFTSDNKNFLDSVCDTYPLHAYVAFVTYVRNAIFINSKKGNPKELVEKVFEGSLSSEEAKFKHLYRFIPVDLTVTSNCDDIISNLRVMLLDYFTDKRYISFDVEIFSHLSPDLRKRFNARDEQDIVQMLQNTVASINPNAYISFYQPVYLISVQIIGSVACLSVLTNYGKYNRYCLKGFKS